MSSADKLNKKMQELWQKYRPVSLTRLETVERAVEALNRGALTEELRAQAAGEAHKLSGSLGTFGYQTASEAAAEIERLLSGERATGGAISAELEKHFTCLKRTIFRA